eukprot:s5030_g3.t2
MRYFLRPSRSRGRSTQHLRCDVVGSTAHSYQVYWVDTQIRGRQASDQGPCWAQQKARAASAAALGQQRGGRRQRRRALQTLPINVSRCWVTWRRRTTATVEWASQEALSPRISCGKVRPIDNGKALPESSPVLWPVKVPNCPEEVKKGWHWCIASADSAMALLEQGRCSPAQALVECSLCLGGVADDVVVPGGRVDEGPTVGPSGGCFVGADLDVLFLWRSDQN